MVELVINDIPVSAEEDATILAAARACGIDIPTLCYFEGLNDIGACRVCVVEVEGEERLSAACNTVVRPGMVVHTDSERVRASRRASLQLILSQHDLNCAYCTRNGTCRLQKLLLDEGLIEWDLFGEVMIEKPIPYAKTLLRGKRSQWPADETIQRRANLCIKCGRCVAACRHLEGIGVWDFIGSGAASNIGVTGGAQMKEMGCVACGQCITHCPTGALSERDDIQRLLDAVADPSVTTVVQIAPATRTSWGVGLGAEDGALPLERMVAALKKIGVDYVFDTCFAADLTIMEEATELLRVLAERTPDENGVVWPMFTSCCPAWVRHAKVARRDALPHLSTAKSPMMMFGAVVKTWFAERNGIDPAKLFSVALMPCTAKKDEAARPALSRDGIPDVDLVLTVRELATLFQRNGLTPQTVKPAHFDSPFMTEATGAAQLFATTGGVMEAALRTVCALTGGPRTAHLAFEPVRGLKNAKEATVETDEFGKLRVAVVYGIREADRILKLVREGRSPYHFVEVMACPGGCIGGGGTNRGPAWSRTLPVRQEAVYDEDAAMTVKSSHENPDVARLYREYLGTPGSRLAHDLLHTHYDDRRTPAKAPLFRQLVVKLHAAECE